MMISETDDAISLTSRPYGQIALIRQALDMAAVSGWLLSPDSRAERVKRVFLLEKENARLSHNTQLNLGLQPERSIRERYTDLQDAADEAGQTSLRIAARETSMPKTTAMLTEIQGASWTEPRNYLGTWQLASGFAHGMPWAMAQLAELSEIEVHEQTASSSYRVTISFGLLCVLIGNAVLLLSDMSRLYEGRSRSHF